MGLSLGVGVALAMKKGLKVQMFTFYSGMENVMKDLFGKLQCSGAHFKLNNLTAIIDNNKLQQTGSNLEIMNTENLADKWKSFRWETLIVDGHNIEDLFKAFNKKTDKPKLIFAKTIKGKGFSFSENNNDWHHKNSFTKTV